ncbi:response regulator transcription factor [Pseudoduganella albidiflava]|uniref:Response regulator n=1 Tax=Pseudoduganella albidiflava TaxID=321983 RepID=A0ABX5RUM3_9BURK|nr:response regulator [Pseudoduganella albidiflava]QBI02327.1 response regulator [Pseudoduganella albidiflava]
MTIVLPHSASHSFTPQPRVLVIDDDPDAADMLAQLLCLNGIDARPAFSGRQAIELAATFEPDVIFLDLGMPVMDGFAVIRALRGEQRSSAYIVALTAWDDATTRARVAAAGFDRHLAKPSSLSAVLAAIAAHCRHDKTEQALPFAGPACEGSRQSDNTAMPSHGAGSYA